MNNINLKKLKNGDIPILAQAITLIESTLYSDRIKANDLIKECTKFEKLSYRICVSGAPGAGKSTFINCLLNELIKEDLKIAVLAIDPSSNESKGSILGDKARMNISSSHENIFVRPSPSKGELGGVSKRTRETIILCETAGFDIVIVETTGVGQTEYIAKEMTDFFILLTIPNSGDYLQAIKKGILEITDLIVINKTENITENEIQKEKNYYHQNQKSKKYNFEKVQTCSSKNGLGINKIYNILYQNFITQKNNGDLIKNRLNQIKYWVKKSINEKIIDKFYNQKKVSTEIDEIIKKIKNKTGSVEELTKKIVDKYLK